jgi:transcription elongation factor GreA
VNEDVKNAISAEGRAEAEAELRERTEVRRPAIVAAIKAAREEGDLSENAEYHAAKDEQAHLETRIAKLRNQLVAARVVDAAQVTKDRVGVGSHVTVQYLDEDETATFQVVGSAEASPGEGRLSTESPFGKALLGRSAGDEVAVQTPGGEMRLAVVSIEAR